MADYRNPSYPAALKMAQLIYTLSTTGRSVHLQDILRILDISERTARRYQKAINGNLSNIQGEDLIRIIKANGVERWQLNEEIKMDATPYQLMSLYVGSVLMSFLDKTVIKDGLMDIFDNIEETLPVAHRAILKNYQKKFYYTGFGGKNYEPHDEQIDVILRGLLGQSILDVTYVSARGEKDHFLHPYTLLMHKDALYLNAFTEIYKEIRTFKIERITRVQLTKEPFDYPADYSPEAMYNRSFGIFKTQPAKEIKVVVEFPDHLHDYVANRTWIANQEVSPIKSGKFRMTATVNDLFEIMHWIMGIGSEARVIKPKSLKEMLREEAKKVLEQY